VKSDAPYLYKLPGRWIFALGLLCERAVDERGYAKRCNGSRDRQGILRQTGDGGGKRWTCKT
jgi:hypothetical protein